MSKKKHRPSSTVETTTPEAAPSVDSNCPPVTSASAALPLHEEIAAFLARREELSRKVAEEIVATEKRLAELRHTAALLLAERNDSPAKDRKPKKLKVKSAEPATARKEPAVEPPAEAVA
jgi:hypothetical protein